MNRFVKARWLSKLAKAKYFVILTDTESVIALEGLNPDKLDDLLALQSQMSILQDFHVRLEELIHEHKLAARQLLGTQPKVRSKSVKTTTNRTTKVNKTSVPKKQSR